MAVGIGIGVVDSCYRFVLDCGVDNQIFVWNGPKSSPAKKTKGAAVAEIIKNHERNGTAVITKLDFTDTDTKFWSTLKGKDA